MAEKHQYTNRLIHEKSPYLLQHAHNPVDWYPWGEEAFKAAKERDQPIFLSIGYATCHWCHVMEKDCFEDSEIASALNQNFINIKVDREELPDIDTLYMEFAQSMMAGAAGWPLNVILTPDLEPFFAATYLPPHNRQGLLGLVELVERIKDIWTSEERERVLLQAAKIVEVFKENNHTQGIDLPLKEQINDTAEMLFKMADPAYGGMKGAPKFPIGYQISFFLRYSVKSHDSRAQFLAERTLDMMHRGGIYDHIGGGFSRYSVDERWLVPHFEKMLYDNAILIRSYLEAYQLTKAPHYQEICEEIINYVLRDMTHSEGAFFSAEDSDSDGQEGKFYVWPYEEVMDLLGDDGIIFAEYYNITLEGNFDGYSILNTPETFSEFAARHKKDPEKLAEQFAMQKKLLWKIRENRNHPFKDDKILTSWNGLMIEALAHAGAAFGAKRFVNAAVRAAVFIKDYLWVNDKLLRRWREGQAQFTAGLDDYASMIAAAITLFEVDCGSEWLEWAIQLAKTLKLKFKAEDGAFYQTDGEDENLILRKCQFADGAEPSGNAVHCENLLRLYRITNDADYLEQAEDILRAVKRFLDSYPAGYIYHVKNCLRYYDQHSPTIIIALNNKGELKEEIYKLIFGQFISHEQIIWKRENDSLLLELIPDLANQIPLNGKTTLYICEKGACKEPITDLEEMKNTLQKL